jgi:pyruvate,water dikinase
MTLTQVWGSLVIFLVCPLIGGLPLISWITYLVSRQKLSQVGTGNVSVSAAFYHGGKVAGILAVISEASKGIAAVLLARAFFPDQPVWELIALIALVMGRYWLGRGAGTTNVVWGIIVHDPITAGLVLVLGGTSFTLFRNRRLGRVLVLFLLALILALRHPRDWAYIIGAIALCAILFWIYQKIPDDLDLVADKATSDSQAVFRFFQGQDVLSLDSSLNPEEVGQKAYNLSELKRQGFPIPMGWVLQAGDDSLALVQSLSPSSTEPLIVRSSAVGEDTMTASAAGQYTSILNITTPTALEAAITQCFASYNTPHAIQYRRDQKLTTAKMAVLVQRQVQGLVSGVAFSRDPLQQDPEIVVIEALPGDATQVVSGQVTPQAYQVYLPSVAHEEATIEGEGNISLEIITQVATLTREIENHYHGIPQDVEWTYDGEQIWILQARPITNLQPIWTRKIAAEVIPGAIRPLTWSINRPLTCGVWGEIFTLVLGNRTRGLDFNQTATLHYAHAYFNATLLGNIFLRMGLPPESLEFLTRGAKFSKPPLLSTLRNLPGLFRLLQREWRLEKDFDGDYQHHFAPTLDLLAEYPPSDLTSKQLLERIERILSNLKRATYYSILAPLSLSLRQAILSVDETQLDNSVTPEVAALQSLARLAAETRNLVSIEHLSEHSCPSLFAALADMPDGENVIAQFNLWLTEYGYLSEVATDIAVPRWRENPRPVRNLFAQCLFSEYRRLQLLEDKSKRNSGSWRSKWLQKRLTLKGQVTQVYSQLLAHLRWSFLALEAVWLEEQQLSEVGELFFLEFAEIQQLVSYPNSELQKSLLTLIQERQERFKKNKALKTIPYVVYGKATLSAFTQAPKLSQRAFQGIAASPGRITGQVKVLRNFQNLSGINEETILVVPYTDSGWSPLLSQAGGLVAEVGGKLSHGAVVAREYGIPAVMNIPNATQFLQDGQTVRIDGQTGVVEILDDETKLLKE